MAANMNAVRHLRYEVTNSATPGTETSHYCDIARDLAAINRRMMQQGRIYHIAKITVVSRNTLAGVGWTDGEFPPTDLYQQNAGFISVSAAPTSWVVIEAAKYGRRLYEKMQDRALEASSNTRQKSKYNDFKIRGLHSGATSPTFLVPKDNGGNSLTLGEWTYSTYISPDGTTSADPYTCTLLGQHVGTSGTMTSVSLVESFGNNRATVSDNVPVQVVDKDDPLANLFDDGTVVDEILDDIGTDNDNPPYSILTYVGGASNMTRPLVMQHSTLGTDGKCTLGGFAAVHGLLEFEVSSPIANDVYSILVELKAGNYKGIAAEAL